MFRGVAWEKGPDGAGSGGRSDSLEAGGVGMKLRPEWAHERRGCMEAGPKRSGRESRGLGEGGARLFFVSSSHNYIPPHTKNKA